MIDGENIADFKSQWFIADQYIHYYFSLLVIMVPANYPNNRVYNLLQAYLYKPPALYTLFFYKI